MFLLTVVVACIVTPATNLRELTFVLTIRLLVCNSRKEFQWKKMWKEAVMQA